MCEHHHKHKSNPLIRISIAVLVFAAGWILHNTFLFLTAYIISGYDILLSALRNIIKGKVFDENFLMGLATLGAIVIREYPEAVMVMILYQIGEYLQHRAVHKSKKSIAALMDLRPDYANLIENGEIIKISPDEVQIGDIILVRAGEKIPLDGIVEEGDALVDTSALTGESVPVSLKTGDNALSGSVNKNGLLRIKVTKLFGESTVSKILKLVENASSKKTRTENFITRFAKIYTPIVVLMALALVLIPVLGFGADFNVWLERALTFLVISCPCALVISVPLGFFAGIGGASKKGILVKGSSYLELLSKPYSIVFDKTGTLTKGSFKVVKILPSEGVSEKNLLKIAAYAESFSNHPVAISIKEAWGSEINQSKISDIHEIAGKGVSVSIEGETVLAGNEKLMKENNITYFDDNFNGTTVYIAKSGKFLGSLIISDEIKEDALSAVRNLKKYSRVIMLTGDKSQSAYHIAQKLGIDEFFSDLLPEGKVSKLEDIILNKKGSVIFVGDGINDAPVLTRSDVGIAMGCLGSDAAIEAADVVIMDDKPSKVYDAVCISKKTMKIVKQNIVFAIGVKALFLILGAVGMMTMWGAVFADVGVTLLAVLNSLRALKV